MERKKPLLYVCKKPLVTWAWCMSGQHCRYICVAFFLIEHEHVIVPSIHHCTYMPNEKGHVALCLSWTCLLLFVLTQWLQITQSHMLTRFSIQSKGTLSCCKNIGTVSDYQPSEHADVCVVDLKPQETLLHFAARRGLQRVTSFLLQQPGARQALALPNRDGATPVTLAQICGHSALFELLTKWVFHHSRVLLHSSGWQTNPGIMLKHNFHIIMQS